MSKSKSRSKTSRRQFMEQAVAVGMATAYIGGSVRPLHSMQANNKLNIGIIGGGGRGYAHVEGTRGENIVAICDADFRQASKAFKDHPDAKKFKDFRKMLEEVKNIDAVTVGIPDHTHAPAAVLAMSLGKHCYCEKPLTHSIYEARVLTEVAARHKVMTQMGNQGTSSNKLREGVEVIRSGAIGKVTEVHSWTNRPIWPQGQNRPTQEKEVPPGLDWDMWLGPAPERPYHDVYLPFKWRGWADFGTGALGDMACHIMNLAYLALELGHPTSAVASSSPLPKESFPSWAMIKLTFPARGERPPVDYYWYDGGMKPPTSLFEGQKIPAGGTLMIGDQGKFYQTDDYGNDWMLLPKEKFRDFKSPEPTLPRVNGNHHKEWLDSCKGGAPALSNFAHSGPFTECVLMGNLAVRLGKRIEWDAKKMVAKNAPEAAALVRREYRKGWELAEDINKA